jgi:hypothetical protein
LATGRGIGRIDGTSFGVTLVSGTLSVRRDRVGNVETTFNGIARVGEALISEAATARGILGNDTTGQRVASVVSTLSVGSDRVGNVRTSFNRVASVGIALISLVARRRDISGANLSCGRVAFVGGTLGIRGNWVGNVLAAFYGIASVSEAQISLVAGTRSISDVAVVFAAIGSINNAFNCVASSLSRAVSISLAGDFAGAKVSVDLVSGGRVASVTGTSSVCLDGVEDLSTSSLTTIKSLVAIVRVTFVGTGTRRRARRGEDDALTARSSNSGLQADVRGIATIGSNAVTLAVAESAARSITSGSRNGLAGLLDETSNERAQFAPITSTEDLVLLSLGHNEQLRIGIDGTYTNSVNENSRNEGIRVIDGSLKIGIKISYTKGLGLIFVTFYAILIFVDFTINFACTVASGSLGGADKEGRNDFVVVTISQHNQDLGGGHTNATSSYSSVVLSLQHVGTVDHTARDASTATAASTRTNS